MEIGLLLPYDEKKAKESSLGVELSSLLDEITELEIRHRYDLAGVLGELKLNIMLALGKIKGGEENAPESWNEADR